MLDQIGLDGQEPQTVEEWQEWAARVKAKIALAEKELDDHVTAEERRWLDRQQQRRAEIAEGVMICEDVQAPPAVVEQMYQKLERLERRELAIPVWMVERRDPHSLLREEDW